MNSKIQHCNTSRKPFKKAYYWKVNSRKLASQVGSVIACSFFSYLFSTIKSLEASPPPLVSERCFQDCFGHPTPWLLSQPLQYLPLSVQHSDTVTLVSEDVLEALWVPFNWIYLAFNAKQHRWKPAPRTAPLGDHLRLLVDPSSDELAENTQVSAGTRNQALPSSDPSFRISPSMGKKFG